MNPVKKCKIRRLYHGLASIRNYIVQDAISQRRDLVVYLEEKKEVMYIMWVDLHKGIKNEKIFKSKHDGRSYFLIDFQWKPLSNSQRKLL